jgi:hypothetical protein
VIDDAHLAPSDRVVLALGGVAGPRLGPGRELLDLLVPECGQRRVEAVTQTGGSRVLALGNLGLAVGARRGAARRTDLFQGAGDGAAGAGAFRAHLGLLAPAAHGLRNLGEVAQARRGDERFGLGEPALETTLARPLLAEQALAQRRVEAVRPRIVPLACDRGEHRDLRVGQLELSAVAPPLLADVAKRILGALPVELVEHGQVREVEHVDLLELRGRTVVRRHHVDREIGEIDDLGVALANACGLDQDQVVIRRLQDANGVGQRSREREVRLARGERAYEDAGAVDGVHAQAVAEQRSPRAPATGIDQQQPERPLRKLQPDAAHQLVDHARLAGAAGAREPDHRRRRPPASAFEVAAHDGGLVGVRGLLEPADEPRHGPRLVGRKALDLVRHAPDRPLRAFLEQRPDHARQAQPATVLGQEDARHPIGMERLRLVGRDGAAAAAVDADVAGSHLAQAIHQIAEVLHVPALVGGDRDRVGVLLHRGLDDLVHRAVVAQVDHLGTLRLQQPAHDVDGRIVPVEQRGRRHDAHALGCAGHDGGRGARAHRASPRRLPPRCRASSRLVTWSRYFWISSCRAVSSAMRPSTSSTWRPSCSSRRSSMARVEPAIPYTAFSSLTSASESPSALSRWMKPSRSISSGP